MDWNPPDLPALWVQELHYFHWLGPELDARVGMVYLADWLHRQPDSGHAAAWKPFAVAMRVLQWTRLLDAWGLASARCPSEASDGEARRSPEGRRRPEASAILASLYRQARFLARRQEFEFLGNHLIKTAAGLYAAGRFFAGAEAASWERQAADILLSQASAQTLPDGGHYERSPMYQLFVVVDLLDVLNMAIEDSDWRRELAGVVDRQLEVVRQLTDPMGDIPLTNDSVVGQAPTSAEVLGYAERVLGRASSRSEAAACKPANLALPDFGLYRLVAGDWFCWIDGGLPGPEFLLAHAHSDLGSVLAWIGGHPLLVEAGVYGYGGQPLRRDYDRNAYGHNVLVLDGHGVCDCWSDFRVARRVRRVDARLDPDRSRLVVSHDGFAFLPGAPEHVRQVDVDTAELRVTDTVRFRKPRRAEVEIVWHLDPAVQLEEEDGAIHLLAGDRRVEVVVRGACRVDVEQWPVARRFYQSETAAVLVVRATMDGTSAVETRFRTCG